MSRFRSYPGQWKLDFFIDDTPAGTYTFTVTGPPSTAVSRPSSVPPERVSTAMAPPAVPQDNIAVEFRGPAGASLVVGDEHHSLDSEGRLTLQLPPRLHRIEATKDGYLPSHDWLNLVPGEKTRVYWLTMPEAVPPTIAVLDPKPGAVIRTADTKLRIEVSSPYQIRSLRVGKEGESVHSMLLPDSTAKAGEPWTAEALVFLGEGDNTFRLEAIDEHGSRAEQTVTVTRQSLVTLELRGPPDTQVKVDKEQHLLDGQGELTLALPPGTYQLEASKDGFAPAPREIISLPTGSSPVQKRLALVPLPAPRLVPAVAPPPADTEAPKIAINYPPPDASIDREAIVITGLVTDNVEVVRVHIAVNGVEVAQPRDIGVVGRGIAIRVPATLQPGENLIEVTAADRAGNVSQVVRAVRRTASAVAAPPAPKIVNRWAVVIGVGEYEHQIPNLRFPVRDAEAMYEFLTTSGGYAKERVILLTDHTREKPTLLNIKRSLGEFLARRAGRDDMVLIYFAGHGAPEVDIVGAETDGLAKYLVPRDADPESLYTTALPMEEIQRIFARIPAERVVMLLDTCYSGTAGGRTFARAQVRASGLNGEFLERLTRSRGRVIITASGPNEVALELPKLGHGVFTYYVLEGLRGKADRNGDGLVTISELYEYVEEQVDRAARLAGGRQRPLMKGEIEGVLPLATAGMPR